MATNNQKAVAGLTAAVAAIVTAVFIKEGGYVNDPKDPGGETNWGITKQVAVEHGYTAPMKEMPKEIAQGIYYKDYVAEPGFVPLVQLSPAVAEKLIDAGVNAGTVRPSRWFQTSLNAVNRGGKDYSYVVVDGKVGPGTLEAYKSLQRVRGRTQACEMVIKMVDAQQTMHYLNLPNLNTFTPGWIINRIGNVPLSKCKND